MKFALAAICLTILFLVPSNCNTVQDEPDKTLKQYLELDKEGARLSSTNYQYIKSLITWEEEPGWDECTIIDNYKVSEKELTPRKCVYEVEYAVIGHERGGIDVQFEKGTEKVEYTLIKINGKWYIDNPTAITEPHVSICALAKEKYSLKIQEWLTLKRDMENPQIFQNMVKKEIEKLRAINNKLDEDKALEKASVFLNNQLELLNAQIKTANLVINKCKEQ